MLITRYYTLWPVSASLLFKTFMINRQNKNKILSRDYYDFIKNFYPFLRSWKLNFSEYSFLVEIEVKFNRKSVFKRETVS